MAYRQDEGSNLSWLEEEIQPDCKWSLRVKNVLHSGKSDFQSVELVETDTYGKVLLLDGKSQSAEADEFVYHELLVHPAMLAHSNPKSVFIAGGGEGATAREVLRHKSVERVLMVDIDKVVCDFCRQHLAANKEAYADPRLEVVNDDAAAQLQATEERFDVIIADLADPVDGGPCYQLYTQEFYQDILKPRLNPGGIFVTQSGPAGVLTSQEVFTPINNTLASVFGHTVAYAAHIPSYVDTWGFNMASSEPSLQLSPAGKVDALLSERINSGLKYLDGPTLQAALALNKPVKKALQEETSIYTRDNPRFIHGAGFKAGQ